MSIEFEAVFEGGVLKPLGPVSLQEHQRVKVVVQDEPSIASRTYGVIGWQGDPEVVEKIALESEFGISDVP